MDSSTLRNKVLEEIQLVSEDLLPDLYNLIHQLRVSSEESEANVEKIMRHAGAWSDMSGDEFADLSEELRTRCQGMVTALEKLAKTNAFAAVDPTEWQQNIRQDRQLPHRE